MTVCLERGKGETIESVAADDTSECMPDSPDCVWTSAGGELLARWRIACCLAWLTCPSRRGRTANWTWRHAWRAKHSSQGSERVGETNTFEFSTWTEPHGKNSIWRQFFA